MASTIAPAVFTFEQAQAPMTSGLPLTADICRTNRHFAFVPIADLGTQLLR